PALLDHRRGSGRRDADPGDVDRTRDRGETGEDGEAADLAAARVDQVNPARVAVTAEEVERSRPGPGQGARHADQGDRARVEQPGERGRRAWVGVRPRALHAAPTARTAASARLVSTTASYGWLRLTKPRRRSTSWSASKPGRRRIGSAAQVRPAR